MYLGLTVQAGDVEAVEEASLEGWYRAMKPQILTFRHCLQTVNLHTYLTFANDAGANQ